MPNFDPSMLPFQPADMFAPGGSLPGTPGIGGHMPSQYEMMMNMMQRQQGNALAAYVLANDPRALAVSSMGARMMGGQNAQSWLKTDAGKLTNMGVSALMNSGALFNAGGNSLDLAFGLQNVIGQGMTGNVQGGAQNQFFAGKGFANDMVTKALYQNVTKDFYGVAGTSNLNRTQGFDRGQIGTLFTEMGRRGMGLGLTGTMRDVKESDYQDQLDGAQNDGERKKIQTEIQNKISNHVQTFDVDPGASKKFRDMAAASLKTIRLLSDITGSDDVAQLMRESEHITGNSYAEQGGANMIRTKIEGLNRTATNLGMNPQSMMSLVSQLGGGQQAMQAATDSAYQIKAYQRERQAALAQGQYLPDVDQGQLAALNMAGQSELSNESSEVMAATYIMQNAPSAAGDQSKIRAHIDAITKATSFEGKADARQQLNEYMSQFTGGRSLNTVFQQMGGTQGITAALSGANKDFVAQYARNEDISRTVAINLPEMVEATNLGGSYGLDNSALEPIVQDVFGKMDTDSRSAMMTAMNKGDVAGVQKALDASGGFTDQERKDASGRILGAMSKQGANLGGALQQMSNDLHVNPMMRNIFGRSTGDLETAHRRETKAWLDENSFGNAPASGNFIDNLVRGAVGAANNGDSQVLQYLNNDKSTAQAKGLQTIDLVKDKTTGVTAASVSDAQAKTLLDKNPGLAQAFGIDPKDKDAPQKLAAALANKNGSGVSTFKDFLDAQGYHKAHGAEDTNGQSQVVFATDQDYNAADKEMNEKVNAKTLSKLTGASADQFTGDVDPKKVGTMLKANSERIIKGFANPDGMMSKDFDELYKKNQAVAKGFLDEAISSREASAQRYKKRGVFGSIGAAIMQIGGYTDENGVHHSGADEDKTKARELEALKKKRAELEGGGNDSGKNGDLVGTVKLIIGDGVLMDIAHARNLK